MEPVAMAVGELEQAKRCLGEALGENSKAYWANMKLWFRQKISKEEFDIEARRLLTHDNVHLHNDFLLSILTKCQIMVSVPGMKDGGPGRSGKSSRKKKLPSLRGKFEHRFQPQDPLLGAPQFCARETHRTEDPSLCSRPLLVPGVPQLTARALVTAWECGLDNMTDEAATYLMSALEYHLKDIVMAVVMRRKAYCLRYGLFRYAFGTTSIPQPYLRNSLALHAAMSQSVGTQGLNMTEEEMEAQVAMLSACSGTEIPPKLPPAGLYDLLEALQVHRELVPSHVVYALNMERILARLWHPSREELEEEEATRCTEAERQQASMTAAFV